MKNVDLQRSKALRSFQVGDAKMLRPRRPVILQGLGFLQLAHETVGLSWNGKQQAGPAGWAPCRCASSRPDPPPEPGPEDCCQNGCHAHSTCVWDFYHAAMKEWKDKYKVPGQDNAADKAGPSMAAASMDAFQLLEQRLQQQNKE